MSTATRSIDVERLLVVCGVGRSGTSLLQAMLAAHPDVVLPPETHFFRRYVARPRMRRRLESGGRAALVARLEADPYFQRCGLSAKDLVAAQPGPALDLARMHRDLCARYAERFAPPAGDGRDGPLRVGDKDPQNLEHLPALRAAFPAACVLHVVRDPRDVVLSRTKAGWAAHRPWWLHALILREQLRRGREQGPALFGERYVEVRYEELLARPAEVLRALCARVELPWSAAMLEFAGAAERLVDADERAWKGALFGPLLAENTEKWRRELSPFQVGWTEAVCRESFRDAEYARASLGRLSLPERLTLGAAPAARTAAALAYQVRGSVGGRR